MTPSHPLVAALADPWGALGLLIDGPLHPGGTDATAALLERAAVGPGTVLLDVGCGCGEAVDVARQLGAEALGVDLRPRAGPAVRGDLEALPVADGAVDVVLAECVLCLSDDLGRTAAELHRVLRPGGRLALSDVVYEGDRRELPAPLARMFCLDGPRRLAALEARLRRAGFEITGIDDHRDDLLRFRDRIAERVDYRGLLGTMGERGGAMLQAIEDIETAIESNRCRYVSLVAQR